MGRTEVPDPLPPLDISGTYLLRWIRPPRCLLRIPDRSSDPDLSVRRLDSPCFLCERVWGFKDFGSGFGLAYGVWRGRHYFERPWTVELGSAMRGSRCRAEVNRRS